MIKLSNSVSEFQWSTAEQVWPFEKTNLNETVYARYYNAPSYTGGNLNIAHGITGIKVFRLYGTLTLNINDIRPLPYVADDSNSSFNIGLQADATNLKLVNTSGGYGTSNVRIYLLYIK